MKRESIIEKFKKNGYSITKVLGTGSVVVIKNYSRTTHASYNAAYNYYFNAKF